MNIKRLLLLSLLCAAVLPLSGQQVKLPVVFSDHEDGIYAKGEEMVFKTKSDRSVEAVAEVLINGVVSKELSPGRIVIPEGESELFRIIPGSPSSVIFRLYPPGNPKAFHDAGAVCSPQDFRPVMKVPSDMRSFWKKEIAALRKVPAHPVLTPLPVPPSDSAAYVAYALEINVPSVLPARGILVMPKNAPRKSLPILMFVHSAGVSRPGNRASVDNALRYARMGNGAIALDINAHGYRDDMPQEYYEELERTTLKGYLLSAADNHADFYYHGMLMRDQRALDYLCSLKEWDGKRVIVTGASQGGFQGAAIAGMDKRVKAIALSEPGFLDMALEVDPARRSCTPRFVEKYGKDHPVMKLIPYYDAANFLRLTKASLWLEAGLVDFTCPPACVIGGYNASTCSRKELHTFPYRTHGSLMAMTEEQRHLWRATVEESRLQFIADYLR